MWMLSFYFTVLFCLYSSDVVLSFHCPRASTARPLLTTKTPSTLHAIQWPFFQKSAAAPSIGNENGIDPNYPWRFEGRFIFRPSLVRVPQVDDDLPPCSNLISLFGYTLGGSVVLEYDVSPVGPYREYVNMGGLVSMGRVSVGESLADKKQMRSLAIGQWGTDLYVSTQVAEDVCKEVWGVPAIVADIEFEEDGQQILCDSPDKTTINGKLVKFNLLGWDNARVLGNSINLDSIKRFGNIPIYWTPTIKALWAPISFPFRGSDNEFNNTQSLPVHKLRLSASALRLKRCERVQQQSSEEIPFGLALVVDNVLIEIGRRVTSGNISIFS